MLFLNKTQFYFSFLHNYWPGISSLRGLFTGFQAHITPSRLAHMGHNLQTLSIPLTAGLKFPSQQPPQRPRKRLHIAASPRKKTDLGESPALKRRLQQIFLQHTRSQKSIFTLLMVLYLTRSHSTEQATQITVEFTVSGYKQYFLSH